MSENVKYNNEKKQFELGTSGEGLDAYTKAESDAKFALKTALTPLAVKTEVASTYATKTEVGNYLLKADATSTYATKATTYTKTEADAKFALKTQITSIEARLTALEGA